jgi:large subunit ribosomal protein L13
MKTFSVKPADIKKKWYVVDATDQTLGRLATEIARVLRGKHKPTFTPYLDAGDHVVVINAAKIKLTGNKWTDKFYKHHTGYMGGIKQIAARDLLAKNPTRLVTLAVRGMLPKKSLGKHILTNLRVYADATHEQDAQKPEAFPVRIKKA